MTDVKVLDHAVAYLQQEFAKTSGNDHETRAALLHALSTRHAAGFEAANSSNRVRNGLSDPALAYLALTFANLDRLSLAGELIGILATRAKTEATAPGRPSRVYWSNSGRSQAIRGAAETTALVDARLCSRPSAGSRARRGRRLAPGPPRRQRLAAPQGQGAGTRRAGVVLRPRPGGRRPLQADRHGQRDPGRRAQRHRLDRGPGDRGAAKGAQGRAAQPGPVRDGGTGPLWLRRHAGGLHPRFQARTGQQKPCRDDQSPRLSAGGTRARRQDLAGRVSAWRSMRPTSRTWPARSRWAEEPASRSTAWRNIPDTTPEWERDFLIVEEHVPAGATVIEGSVQTSATSYHLADGVLTFYFAPDQNPGAITYDVHGYLPGQYRALPASIRSAYEPGRFHLGRRASCACGRRASRAPIPTSRPPTSSTPAARPTSTPGDSPRRAKRSSPSSAATRSVTTSPRTRPACSS